MPQTPVMDRWIRETVNRHLPWSVHVDLTYRCNERCIHCYLDHEDHGEMSTAEIKNVLSQLAESGTLFLTFSGGEIFLRQDIFELIEFARDLHFDVSLKTNALLIDAPADCAIWRSGKFKSASTAPIPKFTTPSPKCAARSRVRSLPFASCRLRGCWSRSPAP